MLKKILVTGGAGFLGSHLCEKLLDAGNDVVCLDNFHTGTNANIERFAGNNHFSFRFQSVADPIVDAFEEIYNLACPASPQHYQSDPVYTFKTSVLGVINLLELAEKTGAKLLQASTSEVYGDPQVNPQVETYLGNVNCFVNSA